MAPYRPAAHIFLHICILSVSCLRQVAQYQEKCVPITLLSFYCRRHFALSAYSQCPNIPFIWTTKGSVKKYGRDHNGAARNTTIPFLYLRWCYWASHIFAIQGCLVWWDCYRTVPKMFHICLATSPSDPTPLNVKHLWCSVMPSQGQGRDIIVCLKASFPLRLAKDVRITERGTRLSGEGLGWESSYGFLLVCAHREGWA